MTFMAESGKGIFFSGIKHSGKTTFAKLYAEDRNLEIKDADDLVLERIFPISVREYYSANGKDSFMKVEAEAVKDYIRSRTGRYVVSLGGGASDNGPLMEIVKAEGTLIYLSRNEKDILEVIRRKGIPPFLDRDNLEASFHELYERRDSIYRNLADIVVDLGPYRDKRETADSLEKILEEYGL